MCGLDIASLILGTIHPIQEGISILRWLLNHFQNFNQNTSTIETLGQLLEENRDHLTKLQLQITKCQPHLSPQGLQAFNKIMSQVKDNIENTYQSLKDIKTAAEKGPINFFSATRIAIKCQKLTQLSQKANDSLVQLNCPITVIEATVSVTDPLRQTTENIERHLVSLERKMDQSLFHSTSSLNEFLPPNRHYQPHIQTTIPSFRTDHRYGPITIEDKIKHRPLTAIEARHVILAIQWEAGVCPETTLHMLTYDRDIRTHFVDGIYYMSLSADASINTVINHLRLMVRTSGGVKVAEDEDKWTDSTKVIEETTRWFRDKTFLLLIDDIWERKERDSDLQDRVLHIVLCQFLHELIDKLSLE